MVTTRSVPPGVRTTQITWTPSGEVLLDKASPAFGSADEGLWSGLADPWFGIC